MSFYPRNAASISREWDEPARESDPEFKDGESVLRESPPRLQYFKNDL